MVNIIKMIHILLVCVCLISSVYGMQVVGGHGYKMVKGYSMKVSVLVVVQEHEDANERVAKALEAEGIHSMTPNYEHISITWQNTVVQRVNTANEPSGINTVTVVRAAQDTWHNVETASIEYDRNPIATTTTCPSLTVECGSQYWDGYSDVGWASFTDAGVLAKAYSGNGPYGAESDITTNTNFPWAENPNDLTYGIFDVVTVMIHEEGHLSGLGHSTVGAAVMYPSVGSNSMKRVLDNDDKAGLAAKYPVTTTNQPTPHPTNQPTSNPTNQPTPNPTNQPTNEPTPQLTNQPTPHPTNHPTPTNQPTPHPTNQPTPHPTNQPTSNPTNQPTPNPTNQPTNEPTPQLTNQPTPHPTNHPTPTNQPTPHPTNQPTPHPTNQPTPHPTNQPTPHPTNQPTPHPTNQPTPNPTNQPTPNPTNQPTPNPTNQPTPNPTNQPSEEPAPAPQACKTSKQDGCKGSSRSDGCCCKRDNSCASLNCEQGTCSSSAITGTVSSTSSSSSVTTVAITVAGVIVVVASAVGVLIYRARIRVRNRSNNLELATLHQQEEAV